FIESHITTQLALGIAVHAYIDHGSPWRHEITSEHLGSAHGRDDDVSLPAKSWQVRRFRVSQRHRGVLRQEQGCHRLTNQIATTNDDRPIACTLKPLYSKQ